MAARGNLRTHRRDQTVTFQLDGRATMDQSACLRRLGEEALAGGASLRIDLRHCTYMDSTFMGTLLCLLRASLRRGTDRFTLVSPSAACQELIEGMGLQDVYPAIQEDEPAEVCQDVAVTPSDKSNLQRNVLCAHQELAAIPGPAAETFERVVQCLTRDMEAQPGAEKK